MDEVFEWKAEIAFKGTAEDFAQFAEHMEAITKAGKVSVRIPEWWPRPTPFPGFWPVDPRVLLGRKAIAKLVEGSPIIDIKYIRDIRGGMRTAHLHLGDQIVLLERETFKQVVSKVAAELGSQRVEAAADYVQVMAGINALAAVPIQLP